MRDVFLCFPESFKLVFTHPKLRFYAFMPLLLSLVVYFLIAWFFFTNLSVWVELFVSNYLIEYLSQAILHYLVSGIIFILFIFLFNWTFVLFVSLISAPFNSILSEKIEEIKYPDREKKNSPAWTWIIFNELKKVVVLMLLTFFSIGLGFAPFMGIFSVILSSLLVAFNFLDFSWSRHHWSWDQGIKDMLKHIFTYLFGGFLFLTLISVPLINLLVPVWATSYFTHLWLKKN